MFCQKYHKNSTFRIKSPVNRYLKAIVGEVTVTKLPHYVPVISYFLKVSINGFVTFKIAVNSNNYGTVTFKIG